MQKFLLEDSVQIVLQVAFVFAQNQGQSTVIISIVSSIISFVSLDYCYDFSKNDILIFFQDKSVLQVHEYPPFDNFPIRFRLPGQAEESVIIRTSTKAGWVQK